MRFIPIASPSSSVRADDGCDEQPGIVEKVDLPLSRREFLVGSGLLMGTLAAGSTLASLAPSTAWALELATLSTHEGETLMAMGRTLYPHKRLPDAVYALLVKDLDGKASDAKMAQQLRDGVAELDRAAGGAFAKATPAKRLSIVKAMQGTPFFATVRGQCVTSVYNNDMAFAVLGYPGSAWEKGGYITRGFQDLKWLPAPPADASPAPFLG